MVHNLIIRGFDDDTYAQLGNLSRQKGVSINSIVKDAVDHWLKKKKEMSKRHHLLLYDDIESKICYQVFRQIGKRGYYVQMFCRLFRFKYYRFTKKFRMV